MPPGFGDLIFQYRRQRGYSQTLLAERAGIDPSYIGGIESGRRPPPSEKTLKAIQGVLGLDEPEALQLTRLATAERMAHGLRGAGDLFPGGGCLIKLALALPYLRPCDLAVLGAMIDALSDRESPQSRGNPM